MHFLPGKRIGFKVQCDPGIVCAQIGCRCIPGKNYCAGLQFDVTNRNIQLLSRRLIQNKGNIQRELFCGASSNQSDLAIGDNEFFYGEPCAF